MDKEIIQVFAENAYLIWLGLFIILIVIEILTVGLTTIWFAAGSLVALIAAACGAPLFVQIALFLVVSILMLVFTRPVAMKYFNGDRAKTNVESLIGRKGVVTGEIDNLRGCGQVTLNGMQWTARSATADGRIPEGNVVTVQAIDGVKLIVEPEKAAG